MPLPTLPVFLSSDERKLIKMLRKAGVQATREPHRFDGSLVALVHSVLLESLRTSSVFDVSLRLRVWLQEVQSKD